MSAVVAHVCESIVAASAAMAATAGDEPLARWLAGARHRPRATVSRPVIVVAAADHGVLDPGPGLGADHPTAVELAAIARGDAVLMTLARAAGARVVVVDAGVAVPAGNTVGAVPWRATADLVSGPAMTAARATAALEGGIAVATALIEDGADLLVLAGLGAGGELAATALVAALTGEAAPADDDGLVAAALARVGTRLEASAALAELGGGDLGVLAGMVLAAAASHLPVVLDGPVATAAALVAATMMPAVGGYLLAAHAGGGWTARQARATLGLAPLVGQGLGRGDGCGGALVLPVLAARLLTPAR